MILDELATHARERVTRAKEQRPLSQLEAQAFSLPKGDFRFEKALHSPGTSLICEIKKASPSKGIISEDFSYLELTEQYEQGGADAVSVLTEPKWFLGSDDIFREVRTHTSLPMIRKDFTVDPYQIYEAKIMGADAVLLIAALLDTNVIRDCLNLCGRLGLDALVEAHDEKEIQSALEAGAQVIGVNNRNLKNFSVDVTTCARLREQIPPEVLFVAESGVSSPEDVKLFRQIGADAVLIGEYLMRSPDPAAALTQLREATR